MCDFYQKSETYEHYVWMFVKDVSLVPYEL